MIEHYKLLINVKYITGICFKDISVQQCRSHDDEDDNDDTFN